MKARTKFIIMGIIGLVLFMGLVPVFPDPYHQEGNVTFFTWVYREIDELIHGER